MRAWLASCSGGFSIMEILLQVMLVTTSVCVAAVVMRRAGRKAKRSIDAGIVSRDWLAEQRVKRKDWGMD
jgi:hypothetical protein